MFGENKMNYSELNKKISEIKSRFYSEIELLYLWEARDSYKNLYKKDQNDLISVYIPTYNRVNLLMTRSLPSVLNQTYKNIEVIIIGDSCTDQTEIAVSNIIDDRITFYSVPKRYKRYPESVENHWFAGPVAAANYALDCISINSKWIARIDDDEIWLPDHLEKLLAFAQKENYEFVSAGNYEIRNGMKKEILGNRALSKYYYPNIQKENQTSPIIGSTSTWLYRTYLKFFKYNQDCWRKDYNKVNDIDLSLRMFEAGVKMGHIGISLITTMPRPGELTVGLDAYLKNKKSTAEKYNFTEDKK